jgi:hypothetical protein
MIRFRNTLRLVLTVTIALVAACPARSAGELGVIYEGPMHSVTNPALEDEALIMQFLPGNVNGGRPGKFGSIDVVAKTSPNGVVTITGGFKEGNSKLKVNGTAQLSATGRFLTGKISVTGTNAFAALTGAWTFDLEQDYDPA